MNYIWDPKAQFGRDQIADYDLCACVGTHVQNTSEIGRFKILSHDWNEEKHTWRMRFKLEELV